MTRPVFGMFGIYRWILASLVMITHFGPGDYRYLGAYAVFAFFILSGYVVSFTLNTHYQNISFGRTKFYFNRALRIYPLYWVVLLASLFVVVHFPEESYALSHFMVLPESKSDWAVNIFAIGGTSIAGTLSLHEPIPAAWSLGTEIFWWLLMPWMVLNWRRVNSWLRIAIAYTAMTIFSIYFYGQDQANLRYYSPLAGMLPFSLGALLYWRKAFAIADMSHRMGAVAIVLCFAVFADATGLFRHPLIEGSYCAMALSAMVIYYFSGLETGTLPAWLRHADSMLGMLSYPLFLLHMLAAVLVRAFYPDLTLDSWRFYMLALLLANGMSFLVHCLVEIPFEPLRRRVRA